MKAKHEAGIQWLLSDDFVGEGPFGWREAHSTHGQYFHTLQGDLPKLGLSIGNNG